MGIDVGAISIDLRELVDCNNDLDTKCFCVLDVLAEIFTSLLERDQILLQVGIVQWFSGSHVRCSAVHLERASGRNNDLHISAFSSPGLFRYDDNTTYSGVWDKPAHSALDVAELLHAHVGTKSTLSKYITFMIRPFSFLRSRKFERNAVGKN